ncbi:YHYH domain-containing protein [Vibrio sp. 10N.261.46.A3]|uniref:YHYH domain-containing protein n=1 Tax=Vibrio sp. 10N.261.46.A3 TaxID=3229658 RepID=UPI0035527794
MKKLIALLALTFSGLTFAHGGALNADGCHNEYATGGYHCHSGERNYGGSSSGGGLSVEEYNMVNEMFLTEQDYHGWTVNADVASNLLVIRKIGVEIRLYRTSWEGYVWVTDDKRCNTSLIEVRDLSGFTCHDVDVDLTGSSDALNRAEKLFSLRSK